jgi:hypothetical protein
MLRDGSFVYLKNSSLIYDFCAGIMSGSFRAARQVLSAHIRWVCCAMALLFTSKKTDFGKAKKILYICVAKANVQTIKLNKTKQK